MANVGDRFTVSSDGEVYAERMPSVGFGPYWQVTGPRVLRGGRVDPTVTAGYGVIRDNGTVNVWGGTGTAGRHYRTFIDMAVADLASGRAAGKLRMRGIGQQEGGKKRQAPAAGGLRAQADRIRKLSRGR